MISKPNKKIKTQKCYRFLSSAILIGEVLPLKGINFTVVPIFITQFSARVSDISRIMFARGYHKEISIHD